MDDIEIKDFINKIIRAAEFRFSCYEHCIDLPAADKQVDDISKLVFDRFSSMARELKRLMARNKELITKIKEWKDDYETVISDKCPTDERHCGCVPLLRKRIDELETQEAVLNTKIINLQEELKPSQIIYYDWEKLKPQSETKP